MRFASWWKVHRRQAARQAAAADFKRRKSILDLVCVSWMWCVWSREKRSRKRKAKWNQKLANSSRHTMRGEISSIQKCELNFPSDSANRRKAPPETQSYEARLMGFVHLLDFRAFPQHIGAFVAEKCSTEPLSADGVEMWDRTRWNPA